MLKYLTSSQGAVGLIIFYVVGIVAWWLIWLVGEEMKFGMEFYIHYTRKHREAQLQSNMELNINST